MKHFEYKSYLGSSNISIEDKCLHGKIEFINDLVTYEAQTIEELEKEFRLAVDDYLEHCHAVGKAPNKTFKGSFNIRIGSELHQKALLKAEKAGKSLNEYIKSIVEKDTASIA
jgi:predicted HicB family RNase H-like nuclease